MLPSSLNVTSCSQSHWPARETSFQAPQTFLLPLPSFYPSPSFSLPPPGFLIHSFPFITETHSCMGEKHLPAASLETDIGGGARRGRKSEAAGMGRELGEYKLRGAVGLEKGLKNTAEHQLAWIPMFQT